MKPKKTWVLVADGSHARFFENQGFGAQLNHMSNLDRESGNLKSGEINSDRPGRSFSSVGPGRSAMEPRTDAQEHQEEEFARRIAELTLEKFQEAAFERLIVIAPDKQLGNLRQLLSPLVKQVVVAELAKNLVHVPMSDLEKQMEMHLPVNS